MNILLGNNHYKFCSIVVSFKFLIWLQIQNAAFHFLQNFLPKSFVTGPLLIHFSLTSGLKTS